MKDKNGIEIKTGMIVRVSGAYFKHDNGLYFVDNSPGDPSWSGSDYSLHKICKNGKISTTVYCICFWPIKSFVSDRRKTAEANSWNAQHAEIEVVQIANMAEVKARFQEKAANLEKTIQREAWDLGEDSKVVQTHRALQAHYEAIAATM